ncbi:MAG: YqgE/AlgH family protein [Cyclobacteriaceae bacterium]|nr:YqgE/AlgH family protein [Cyclobacteriaceae bacterium]
MNYFSSDQYVEPSRGDLLISEPYLPDPNFERTVVLLCEHDENGTFGFVLNKRSPLTFNEVIEDVDHFDAPLFVGGPVQQNSLHFIHRAYDLMGSGKEIKEGLFWGGDFDKLLTLIDTHQVQLGDFRFFAGYSGWSPGQLEEELKVKSWIVYKNVDPDMLFTIPPDELWQNILRNMGGKYKVMANYPLDPRLN